MVVFCLGMMIALAQVPPAYDCSMRRLALGYAKHIQPHITDESLQQIGMLTQQLYKLPSHSLPPLQLSNTRSLNLEQCIFTQQPCLNIYMILLHAFLFTPPLQPGTLLC